MAKLKAYTLGNNGFVDTSVLEALGEPTHMRQASVLVFATSKREAIDILHLKRSGKATVACPYSVSDPEFRVSASLQAEAFLGSWVDEPTVVVMPINSRDPNPVVRIDDDGHPEFWGVLRRIHGRIVFSPEQMPADR